MPTHQLRPFCSSTYSYSSQTSKSILSEHVWIFLTFGSFRTTRPNSSSSSSSSVLGDINYPRLCRRGHDLVKLAKVGLGWDPSNWGPFSCSCRGWEPRCEAPPVNASSPAGTDGERTDGNSWVDQKDSSLVMSPKSNHHHSEGRPVDTGEYTTR